MKHLGWNRSVGIALLVLGANTTSAAVPTDTQKCQSAKAKEIGKYALCRLKADAKAIKKGEAPDYVKCDDKVRDNFDKIEAKLGVACPAIGDVDGLIADATTCTTDLACEVQEPTPPSGSIVAFRDINVSVSEDSTFVIRNTSSLLVRAQCVYFSDGCQASDFVIELFANDEIEWSAGMGNWAAGIPPLPSLPFGGDLVCVETDLASAPTSGNHLVATQQSGSACPSPAVSIAGNELNDGSLDLCLGGSPGPSCPNGGEYDACPGGLDSMRMEGCWSTSAPGFVFICNGP